MLLSERNPEPNRYNRTRALPFSGLIIPVAIRSNARLNPEGGRAVSLGLATQRAKIESSQPDDLRVDPLYLFVCGLSWRRRSNTTAGWELVRCLRSSGQTARIAAALLGQALRQAEEDMPVQPGLCAMDDPGKPSLPAKAGSPASARRWV